MARPANLSIIIPVYNEQEKIEHSIITLFNYLEKNNVPFAEVIITEDGSKDNTVQIVKKLLAGFPKLKLNSMNPNKGRGYALNGAIAAAKGDVVLYMDVDLATDLRHIGDAVSAIANGADVALGSRYARRNEAYRTIFRVIPSKFYNLFTIIAFGSKLLDHQCGFKAFNREKILPLLPKIKDLRWFWDTELLIKAQRAGLKIAELPVTWHEGQATKVKVLRDSYRMLKSIIKLRLELWGF